MRIHRIIPCTRAEGPGLRFTIWVQGCHNYCRGCYATALWDENGGWEISTEDLIRRIRETPGIEGITFLGGEPMEQAGELAKVAAAAREMGLSVLTFTGLVYERILDEAEAERLALLAYTDLLIDGPYLPQRHDTSRPWVGSDNQRYLFLSDRYTMQDVVCCRNRVELRVSRDGVVRLNGMGDFAALERMLNQESIVRGNEDGTYKV